LKSGKELLLPTPFDDFTERAHNDYMQLTPEVLNNRSILKNTMTKYGFIPLETEWWHFYLPNAAQRFELLDLDFKTMQKISK
jgi:D-alanyl-D-alanine dipeptidase